MHKGKRVEHLATAAEGLTHTHTDTVNKGGGGSWHLPSNPVTLRISVTYTAITFRPLAAPSARNWITVSKICVAAAGKGKGGEAVLYKDS